MFLIPHALFKSDLCTLTYSTEQTLSKRKMKIEQEFYLNSDRTIYIDTYMKTFYSSKFVWGGVCKRKRFVQF